LLDKDFMWARLRYPVNTLLPQFPNTENTEMDIHPFVCFHVVDVNLRHSGFVAIANLRLSGTEVVDFEEAAELICAGGDAADYLLYGRGKTAVLAIDNLKLDAERALDWCVDNLSAYEYEADEQTQVARAVLRAMSATYIG
jgi:hypothetical protein